MLTRTVIGPSASPASVTNRGTSSRSSRSAWIATARPPASSMAATVSPMVPGSRSSHCCRVRATTATAAPSAARARAVAPAHALLLGARPPPPWLWSGRPLVQAGPVHLRCRQSGSAGPGRRLAPPGITPRPVRTRQVANRAITRMLSRRRPCRLTHHRAGEHVVGAASMAVVGGCHPGRPALARWETRALHEFGATSIQRRLGGRTTGQINSIDQQLGGRGSTSGSWGRPATPVLATAPPGGRGTSTDRDERR